MSTVYITNKVNRLLNLIPTACYFCIQGRKGGLRSCFKFVTKLRKFTYGRTVLKIKVSTHQNMFLVLQQILDRRYKWTSQGAHLKTSTALAVSCLSPFLFLMQHLLISHLYPVSISIVEEVIFFKPDMESSRNLEPFY